MFTGAWDAEAVGEGEVQAAAAPPLARGFTAAAASQVGAMAVPAQQLPARLSAPRQSGHDIAGRSTNAPRLRHDMRQLNPRRRRVVRADVETERLLRRLAEEGAAPEGQPSQCACQHDLPDDAGLGMTATASVAGLNGGRRKRKKRKRLPGHSRAKKERKKARKAEEAQHPTS